jgi:hypothetical protein
MSFAFDASSSAFSSVVFDDIQAVGVYLAQPDFSSVETKLTFDHFQVRATVVPSVQLASSATQLQSELLTQDVNGDGTTTALDALIVINLIGEEQSNAEGEFSRPSSRLVADVNRDGRVSAADALSIINYLGHTVASRELPVVLLDDSIGDDLVDERDEFAKSADLLLAVDSGPQSLVPPRSYGGESAQVNLTSVSSAEINSSQTGDADDDSVLTLLAADILKNLI